MSSVVDGFQEYREAARRGITKAAGEAILANEDFPSLSESPRNACLDAIASSDCLVVIVGQRGGWKSPSGMLVVEEECEYARRRKIPILAFLQDIKRDEDGERLANRISDYVTGEFRTVFTLPAELEDLVATALQTRFSSFSPATRAPVNLSEFFPSSTRNVSGNTTLRFVVVPERKEEVLDPVRLASAELLQQVYQVGHLPDVALLNYSRPKSARTDRGRLIVDQTDPGTHHDMSDIVHVEIFEDGIVVLEGNVTGRFRRGDRMQLMESMVIAVEDVEAILRTFFHFVGGLYDGLDPFHRHHRFFMNAALRDTGYRTLRRNPQPTNSTTMRMSGDGDVTAYEESRIIDRNDLKSPESEIARAVTLFERRFEES